MTAQPTPWAVEMRVTLGDVLKGEAADREKAVFLAMKDIESRGIMEPVIRWTDPYTLFVDLASVAIDADQAASTAEDIVRRRLSAMANLTIRDVAVEGTRPLLEG